MGSLMVRRPHDSKDQIHRHEETSIVDVFDLDMVVGDHGEVPENHVPPGKGETHHLARRRVLVEECPERLSTTRAGLRGLVGWEHRPTGDIEFDVGDLARPVDRHVVLAGGDHGAAEAVSAEFDRDSLAPVGHLFGLIGEVETTATVDFGQPLVLSGLLVPLPPGSLTELGGEIGVGLTSVFHSFSRSRHPTPATG